MKKIVFTISIFSLLLTALFAQAPQSFKYQAIARDMQGNILANQEVSLKISLLQGGESGQVVYSEILNLKTSRFGLINLEIGNGNQKSGDMTNINWGSGSYFVSLEMDKTGGSNFASMGASQLLSVPYALYAEKSGSENEVKIYEHWARVWYNGEGIYKTYLADVDGNLGVGITNPLQKLHVGGSLLVEGSLKTSEQNIEINEYGSGDRPAYFDLHSDDTYTDYSARLVRFPGADGNTKFMHRGTGTLSFTAKESASIAFLTKNSERMRISSDGRIGVGTSNPGAKLEIRGSSTAHALKVTRPAGAPFQTIYADAPDPKTNFTSVFAALYLANSDTTNNNFVRLNFGDGSTPSITAIAANITDHTNNYGHMVFWTRGSDGHTEKLRIEDNGNVGIGTTNPDNKFSVNGDSDFNGDVGIGTSNPNASAAVEISSTTQGFLPPRMTESQMNAIANPALGLMIFCTDCTPMSIRIFNGYYWLGSDGVPVLASDEVYNPVTGRIWKDRNLGASQVATSSTDAASYGDLYQWGRATDGHESRTSGTTSTVSTTDTPGHADFITCNSSPYDWRSTQNDNLWQGVSGTNNPCPNGFRLPTEAEWEAERLSWSSNTAAGAFASPLKLPMAARRYYGSGSVYGVGSSGSYWSSTVSVTDSWFLGFSSSSAEVFSIYRADGYSVRCLKN